MLLAIDIGNTTIGFAVIQKGTVPLKGLSPSIVTIVTVDTNAKTGKIKAVIAKVLKAHVIERAVICSVVPKVTKVLERILSSFVIARSPRLKHSGVNSATKQSLSTVIPVSIIGRDIKVPVINRYKNPKQVGQDRLTGAYAAMKIYGCPLIVVDLGTAITFDVISPKKEYLGGAIVPGLRLSAESLFLKTALLPRIEIQAPRHIIGKTTRESILSGLFYGYGSLCRGVIDLIRQEVRAGHARPVQVIMTGGHTRLMKKFVSPKIRIIDENLVFKGIYFLAYDK